jgi:hypothetical protein
MKRTFFILTSAVFLLANLNVIQAQTTQANLNQIELIKQFLGTWKCDLDKDTIEMWECSPYGDIQSTAVSLTIKGKKTDLYLNNAGFDKRDGHFKGLIVYTNGDYYTWIGMFTTEKKFNVDIVDNLQPEKILAKFEFDLINPTSRIMTRYTTDGIKVKEYKFNKVK